MKRILYYKSRNADFDVTRRNEGELFVNPDVIVLVNKRVLLILILANYLWKLK